MTREELWKQIALEAELRGLALDQVIKAAYNKALDDAVKFIEDEGVSLEGDEQDGYGMQLFLERLGKLKI